jgi:Coenzyme PQQ synthesis protein D (PqqD)
MYPRALQTGLLKKTVGDQLILYDQEQNSLHTLNHTAAAIWRLCNGQRTVAEVARQASQELGATVDDSVVWLALEQLHDAGLLAEPVANPMPPAGVSRRTLVRRASAVAAGVLLPAIASVNARSSARADALAASELRLGQVPTTAPPTTAPPTNTPTDTPTNTPTDTPTETATATESATSTTTPAGTLEPTETPTVVASPEATETAGTGGVSQLPGTGSGPQDGPDWLFPAGLLAAAGALAARLGLRARRSADPD